jgi:hypothetical protein
MKALKIIGITFLVIILFIVGYGMTLSGESRVERSITINSPANKVFKEVNTFNNILDWSPWTKIDPETEYEYSATKEGLA